MSKIKSAINYERKLCRPRNHEFIILKLLRTAENESIQSTDDLGSVRPTKSLGAICCSSLGKLVLIPLNNFSDVFLCPN